MKLSPNSRYLPPITDDRVERLRRRIPLTSLAVESGIPPSTLSEAERGLRDLSPEQQERRDAALHRLNAAVPGDPNPSPQDHLVVAGRV